MSQNKMATEPILKLIIAMSLPSMISMLIQALYNVVDSFFVAKISENALTAIALAAPVQIMIIAVAVGTGIGINSLIARSLGAKKADIADKTASHGILLGVSSWILFALLAIFFTKPFFRIFDENPEVFGYACDYTYIVTIGCFAVFMQIQIEKILQSTGSMIYPMLFQLTGAIMNIILDPIFIFTFGMGVRGAAIATLIGQFSALIFSAVVLIRKNHTVTISLKNMKPDLKIMAEIYKVGFPAIVMQGMTSLLVVMLNGILIGFSGTAVSFFGIYYRLQMFIFMPIFGLNNGIMPIAGFNYGAGNKKRLFDTIKFGIIISAIIMSAGILFFEFLPAEILGIFSATPEMIELGVPALRIIGVGFFAASVTVVLCAVFQAVGMGFHGLAVSLTRQLLLLLPLFFFFSKISLQMAWLAFPLSEYISLILALIIARRVKLRIR